MKKILLVCSAGMSTSLLVTKMEEAAEEAGIEITIFALPFASAESVINDVDVVLLGPQVRFQKNAIDALVNNRVGGPVPVDVINMKDYGKMDGKAVFEFARSLIKE